MAIKYDEWRPFRYDSDDTQRTTTTVADNETAPTNWERCKKTTFADMPAGVYRYTANFVWALGSNRKSAMFRLRVTGAPDRILRIEPKDANNVLSQSIVDVYTNPNDGPVDIELQYLVNRGSGSTALVVENVVFELARVGD